MGITAGEEIPLLGSVNVGKWRRISKFIENGVKAGIKSIPAFLMQIDEE